MLLDRVEVLHILALEMKVPQEVCDRIAALPAVVPQVAANISGGILQGYSYNYPVDLYCLDYDDIDPDCEFHEIDGSQCTISCFGGLLDPDFVQKVIDAEPIEEEGERL